MSKKPSLYIVDASAMFFRAYYAIRPLTSKSGVPTNAIYGYLSMMVKLLKDIKPEYLAVCYDRKGPSFRNDIDPEYKANRSETPEDLVQQLPYMRKLTTLLGLSAFEKEKYEADDLIGSLAKFGRRNDLDVVIVSGDKDFAQLIEPGVTMFDPMKNVTYDEAKVMEKWGVRPDQFLDYLAIVGDSSDNVPGVKGIGPKGAQKLLGDYQTLEEVYNHVDEIKGATQKKLKEGHESALRSKELVTIVTGLDVVNSKDELIVNNPQSEELRGLFQELSITTFEKSLLGEAKPAAADSASASAEEAVTVQSEAREFKEVEVSPDTLGDFFKPQSNVHFLESDMGLFMANETTVARMTGDMVSYREPLERASYRWSGYDLKSLWHRFELSNPVVEWDHQLAQYVIDANDPKGLRQIVERNQLTALPDMPTGSQLANASFDLIDCLSEELQRVSGEGVYRGLDLPLVPILYKMERRGIRIDRKLLDDYGQELGTDIEALAKEIHELAEEEFNIASPKQLGAILFEKLKLPTKKKTKTGFSTDNEVLLKLADLHPICNKVLNYRELTKLKSTYVDALPEAADKSDRIHSNFRQALTATGRLSSNHPNLQNIPIRTERGQKVREAFIASDGMILASVDYSQIELRVLAHFAADDGLQRAFEKDLDVHTMTASEIYGVDFDSVTSDQRRHAKAVNFGIAYGQGPFGLAESLGISRTDAKDIIARYFEKFPGVKSYMEGMVEDAKSRGFVETLVGRRRYLPELKAKNPAVKKFGERAAINAPIQGTASDLVKKAMIEAKEFNELHMLLQVHDELLFEAPPETMDRDLPEICKKMETVANLSVPLRVNAHTGQNWDEAH